MELDIKIGARPLSAQAQKTPQDTMKAAAVGAVASTIASGAFHHFGPPRMAFGKPWAAATLGVGLMGAISTAVLYSTNHTGDRTNSMLESTALSAVAFGVPGLAIHGKMDFSGKPVNGLKAAMGVALIGAIAGPLIHQLTTPDS